MRQLQAANDQLFRLSNHLIAQDTERQGISRELHDGLGQELAVASMIVGQILHAA